MLVFVTDRPAEFAPLLRRLLLQGVFFNVTTHDKAKQVCDDYEVMGVAVDCVWAWQSGLQVSRRLHRAYPSMPIATICPTGELPDRQGFYHILPSCEGFLPSFEGLLAFCRHCGWVSTLSSFYLYIENDPQKTCYMGYPLRLSEPAHRILRCLFYRYPSFTTKDDLVMLCSLPGEPPIASPYAIIQNINRRAARINPHPLIVNDRGHGFCLRDGLI